MTNAEIAATFETIGTILDLLGENKFRILAYRKAALVVAALPRDVADIYREGGTKALQEIGGIGKDLSQKMEEMVKTGKLTYLAQMRKKIPEGLLPLMQLEGMGPKKTKMVWEKLKVRSIEDLERVAKSGKLALLPGWGKQSAQKVMAAIAQRRSLGTRMGLPAAMALADVLLTKLQQSGLCDNVSLAGSIRRQRETIGDIDLLASSSDPEKVMDFFGTLREVARVMNRGPTKSSVVLRSGIQADLRVVDPEVFGAALHYFTGSKDHNVKVRTMAVKKGITISEYGVYKGSAEKKGKLLACATEEDVFRTVGLPYIPPEIREDRGEVEAGLRGALPTLLEERDIAGDLHLHTTFSDGSADAVTMARAAKERGLQYIAITDHGSGMGMVKGIKKGNIGAYLQMIDEARTKVPGISILAGVEVDIEADGSLYLPDDILAQLDWVVASVHSHFHQSTEAATKRLLRAISNPHVDVIGHPTGRLLLKRPAIEFSAETVFRAAAKQGVALEINASVERMDLSDVHAKLAKDLGAKIVISSDAHDPTELTYRYGVSQARRGWIEKKDTVNAMGWTEFERWRRG